MKKLLMICILMVSILFVSGCASLSKPENIIIGKWQEIDGTETIEFFKDGTVNIVDKTISVSGDFKFVDDNKLRLDLGRYGTEVVEVSISRNELIIEQNGKVHKYQRMGATNTGESKNNIKIQEKLETPEGVIVKIELVNNELVGVIENPTNINLEHLDFGVLVKHIDESYLDRKYIWDQYGDPNAGFISLQSGRSQKTSFMWVNILLSNDDTVSEIKPFVKWVEDDNSRKMYPPCFNEDPRKECYDYVFQGEGWTYVPINSAYSKHPKYNRIF